MRGTVTLDPLSPFTSSGIAITADEVTEIVPFEAVDAMLPSLRSCRGSVTAVVLPAAPTAWNRIQAISPDPDSGVMPKREIAIRPGAGTDQLISNPFA